MKITTGYNANMLSIARDIRGYSGVALAKATGIPKRAMYKYLGGDEPTREHLEKIAAVLEYPVAFFFRAGERYVPHPDAPPDFPFGWKPLYDNSATLRERAAAMLASVPDEDLPALLAVLDDWAVYGDNIIRLYKHED